MTLLLLLGLLPVGLVPALSRELVVAVELPVQQPASIEETSKAGEEEGVLKPAQAVVERFHQSPHGSWEAEMYPCSIQILLLYGYLRITKSQHVRWRFELQ